MYYFIHCVLCFPFLRLKSCYSKELLGGVEFFFGYFFLLERV